MFAKKNNENIALGNLIEGLPVPQYTALTIKLVSDNLIITGNNQEFNLNISKIMSIDFKSDVEMEKIIHQSAPGMIIGAVTFGVVGAMIGGRVKTKEKRNVSHFLIINYKSGELKTIVVNATKDWDNASKFVDYFRKIKPATEKITVEL